MTRTTSHRIVGPALARVLIVTVMVAASGSARGTSGDDRESTGGGPPIERQFKGQLDPIGPFSWNRRGDLAAFRRARRPSEGDRADPLAPSA